MTLSLETPVYLGSPMAGVAASPLTGGRKGSASKFYKPAHTRRRNSNGVVANSGSSAASPASVTAFPSFDPTYEHSTTYVTANPPSEPMPLFSRRSEDQTSSAFTKKIKPLVRHQSSRDKVRAPIDLNMSQAENEERGAYVSDISRGANAGYRGGFGNHTRTTSSTSQMSASSTHSSHLRSTYYVHATRQTSHPSTPPIPNTVPYKTDEMRPSSSHSNLNNVPALPLPGQCRPALMSAMRSNTGTPPCVLSPSHPPTPVLSSAANLPPSVPTTSRSSMDSSFRDRIAAGMASRHRSRANSNAPLDAEEQARAVAALREDFNLREAAKDEKYRLREEKRERRRSEAEDRKARRRRGNSGATAGSTGSGIAASSISGGSELAGGNGAASTRKGRSGSGRKGRAENERNGRRSMEQLEAISYDSTTQSRRPTMITDQLDEENEKQHDIPKRGKRQGLGSAGKATQSLWMTFWFKVKTALLKMMVKRQ